MTARVAYRVFVSGKVQDVYFRLSTQQKAVELGAQGWVRNLRDGRVEAQVEGAREAVDALLAWLEQGPSAARVDALHSDPVAPEGSKGFELRATV